MTRDTNDRRSPPVLMYHSVADYDDDPLHVTVSPDRFERQLRWMRAVGLHGVSVRDLLEARRGDVGDSRYGGRRLVGLTFDDGYEDFATEVAPVLARFSFTATVFVVAGRLGGDNAWESHGPRKRLMTTEQVAEVAAAGMEVGSHGLRHRCLPSLDAAPLADEVVASRAVLRELADTEVAGFCYPYGDVDGRVHREVRAAGYDYACAVRPNGLAGRLAIPRMYVGEADRALRLSAKWARHYLGASRSAVSVTSPGMPGTNLPRPNLPPRHSMSGK